jgi:predicted peptidase
MRRLLILILMASSTECAKSPLIELNDPATFAALAHSPAHTEGAMPLLLYLHGAGESGSNIRKILSDGATGTPPVELEQGTALPVLARQFVVVAPQTSHGWDASEISRFLDFLLSGRAGLPAIDPKRCYVTGHSMGGAGALYAGTTRRFAAVVPVAPAGSVPPSELAGVPVWAFHGSNDVVVPSGYSERLVKKLRAAGASEDAARLTLYENAPAPVGWSDYDGHASTVPAYATGELYRWLLEHSLK